MSHRIHRTAPFVLAGVLLAGALHAQENRAPTPAEQRAVTRYNTVMTGILDGFASPDWAENDGQRYTLDDALVHPNSGRPLDITAFLGRAYDVQNGSARFQRILPLIQKLQAEHDATAQMKIGGQIQDMMHLAVEVHFNWLVVTLDPPPSQNQDLRIPGVALAYKVRDDSHAHGAAYVLLFGDWQKAKWDAAHGGLAFSFAHAENTPYIENIVVQLWGADDRIQELLKTVHWSEVHTALTP